jgi:hypothetical protein
MKKASASGDGRVSRPRPIRPDAQMRCNVPPSFYRFRPRRDWVELLGSHYFSELIVFQPRCVHFNARVRCSCAFQQFRCADILTAEVVTLESVVHFDRRRFERPATPASRRYPVGRSSISRRNDKFKDAQFRGFCGFCRRGNRTAVPESHKHRSPGYSRYAIPISSTFSLGRVSVA